MLIFQLYLELQYTYFSQRNTLYEASTFSLSFLLSSLPFSFLFLHLSLTPFLPPSLPLFSLPPSSLPLSLPLFPSFSVPISLAHIQSLLQRIYPLCKQTWFEMTMVIFLLYLTENKEYNKVVDLAQYFYGDVINLSTQYSPRWLCL